MPRKKANPETTERPSPRPEPIVHEQAPQIGARYCRNMAYNRTLKRARSVCYREHARWDWRQTNLDLPISDVGIWEFTEAGWVQHHNGKAISHGHHPILAPL